MPTFRDYYENNQSLPPLITFSFAALLAFYRSSDLRSDGLHAKRLDGTEYVIHDDAGVLSFFAENSEKATDDYVTAVASHIDFWGQDMTVFPGFVATVSKWLDVFAADPIRAVTEVLQ